MQNHFFYKLINYTVLSKHITSSKYMNKKFIKEINAK